MLRKFVFVFIICFTFTVYANKAPLGSSEVLVTNNTNHSIHLSTQLSSNDSNVKRGQAWDAKDMTLLPYESKWVLWFSRHDNLQRHKTYRFTINATHPDKLDNALSFAITATSKLIYGTDINAEIIFPDSTNQFIFKGNDFLNFDHDFWNDHYKVYARSWLPKLRVYNHFHFVINNISDPNPTPSTLGTIRILSYNTQLMPFYAGSVNKLNNPAIRAVDIPKKISKYDVVICQELFDHDLRHSFKAAMKAFYPYHSHLVGEGGPNILNGGVMIFSKWPIQKQKKMIYQAGVNMDGFASKGVIYIVINKQGNPYHIFGSHLQSGSKAEEVTARHKQFIEFAQFIQLQNIPYSEPVLLGGDFNTDISNGEIYQLLNILNVNLPKNIGYPFSSDSTINTMHAGDSQKRIDFVFTSNAHIAPTVAYNNIFILRAFDDQRMWPDFDLSDHFPVEGYFNFMG